MTPVSKAQKFRLGLFLLVAGVLMFGTIAFLIGAAALEDTDTYVIRFDGSISGLEQGSQVRYNGIRVGRVTTIEIDPQRVSEVKVSIELDGGTPVKTDTMAVLNMQGITGMKYIELSGGTNEAGLVEPGSEIPAGGSNFDELTETAERIAAKIEALLNNLVEVTGDSNREFMTSILTEVDANLRAVRGLLESEDLKAIMANTNTASAEVVGITQETRETLVEVRQTVVETRQTIARLASSFDPRKIRGVLDRAEGALAQLEQRLGPAELGQTLASTNRMLASAETLVTNLDVTVVRTRDDMRRILDVLITGTENFADFTQILVDNPAALISGRNERDRQLP